MILVFFSAINFEMETGNSILANTTIKKITGNIDIYKPMPTSHLVLFAKTIFIKNSTHSPINATTTNKMSL